MTEPQHDVRQHYGIPALAAKVVAALEGLGIDAAHLKAEQLYPFDQLHGRNIEATRDHVGRLGLKAGERIAGFVYIGTAKDELEERPRPDMDRIVTVF